MNISDWSSDVCSSISAGIVIASDIYRTEKKHKQNSAIHPTEFRHEFAEYFHEEVLDLQPQAVRDFIVDTSILTELTPSACAAVARSDDARAALDAAYSAGLLLNVTDREDGHRSEEHTSELKSLMRIAYAVYCLKK